MSAVVVGIVVVLVLVLLFASVLLVRPNQAVVLRRGGGLRTVARSGLVLRVPLVDRVAARIDLREQLLTFAELVVPAADGRSVTVGGTVRYTVTDPAAFAGRVAGWPDTLARSTADRVRGQVGTLDAEETVRRQRAVGDTVRAELSAEAASWGVTVNTVEVTAALR